MARTSVRNIAIVVVLVAAAVVGAVIYHSKKSAPATTVAVSPVSTQQVEAIAGGVNDNVAPELKKLGTQHNDLAKAYNELKAKFEAEAKARKEQPVVTPEQIRSIVDEKMKGVKEAVPPGVPVSEFKALQQNFPLRSAA
ncbi:MAG: hypothetical protein KA066_00760 [Candidatus Pacebacteria bacterium]|nr:hypothetical protein [Candidatus Paceibacterota bacterium]